jgi:hypothetical protein
MTQVVELLPSKCKVLSLISITERKEGKKERKKEGRKRLWRERRKEKTHQVVE